ncbi:hypothetical protein [Paraclostridium bifermentans]|uniref:hypothetical protein n=1 Tax=Paraclostridium bifermentans TaxID=1490 RepID=UPI00374F151A
MISVLRIGPSVELVVYDNHKLLLGVTLSEGNILTEAYGYLKDLDITDFRVVVLPVVKSEFEHTNDLEIFSYDTPNIRRVGYMSSKDLEQVCELAHTLKLTEVSIFNQFDVYTLLAGKKPCIVIGRYNVSNQVYYLYVTRDGVQTMKLSSKVTKKNIAELMSRYETDNIINERNLDLVGKLQNLFLNLEDTPDEDLSYLYPLLCTDLIRPVHEKNVEDVLGLRKSERVSDLDFDEDDLLTPEAIDERLGEIPDELDELEHTSRYPKNMTKSHKGRKKKSTPSFDKNSEDVTSAVLKQRYTCMGLDIVGSLLAITLAFTLLGNKEIPKNVTEAHEKVSQIEQVLKPKEETVAYLNEFNSKLKNGGTNEAKLLTDISAIKVDGMFGEAALSKNQIDLTVYVKDNKNLDKYKKEVSKYMTIKDITKLSSVSEGDTKLQKYSIMGSIK